MNIMLISYLYMTFSHDNIVQYLNHQCLHGIISKVSLFISVRVTKDSHVDELVTTGTYRCRTHTYQCLLHSTCTNVDCIRY